MSPQGKEATLSLLDAGNFVGEQCVAAAERIRVATATALTRCAVLRIEKPEKIRVLHEEHAFADVFVAFLLARNARIQADVVDQLFNSSEKRLARVLLLLAHFGKDSKPETVIPKISQEVLAEMIGTTRSRVNFFMNRFRKLGFIDYNGGLEVHNPAECGPARVASGRGRPGAAAATQRADGSLNACPVTDCPRLVVASG